MNWNPSEQNRVGILLQKGLSDAGQSLAEGIKDHARQLQEKKGLLMIGKAIAQDPTSGVTPDQIDKMSQGELQQLALATEIRRQTATRQQQARARMALPGFVDTVNQAQQPQVMAPGVQGPPKPGMNPLQAVMLGLQRNPAVLDTDEGKDALATVVKRLVTPQKPAGVPQFTTVDGRTVAIEPNGTTRWAPPVPQPKPAAGTVGRPNPAAGLDPEEDLVPYMPPGSKTPVPGLYKRMKGGKAMGFWQDTQNAPRTTAATGQPAWNNVLQKATSDDAQLSPVITTRQNGIVAPAVGDISQGYRFLGGDPADKANWEPAGE